MNAVLTNAPRGPVGAQMSKKQKARARKASRPKVSGQKVKKQGNNTTAARKTQKQVKTSKKARLAAKRSVHSVPQAPARNIAANANEGPPPSCFTDTNVISIAVGPEKKRYNLLGAVLACRSKYFQRLTRAHMPAANGHTLLWPNEEPAIVDLFVPWAYGRGIDVSNHDVDRGNIDEMRIDEDARLSVNRPLEFQPRHYREQREALQVDSKAFLALFKLWLFAERKQIPALQNAAINKIHELALIRNRHPAWCDTVWTWHQTRQGSPLRKFLIECMVIMLDLPRFNDEGIILPNAMTSIFVRRLSEVRLSVPRWNGLDAWRNIDLCLYHVHTAGEIDCHGNYVEEDHSGAGTFDEGDLNSDVAIKNEAECQGPVPRCRLSELPLDLAAL